MTMQEELNVEYLAHELTTLLNQRMVEMRLPDTEVQSNANILFEFAKIAGKLIQDEGGFPHPVTNENVPYDLITARQIMDLFTEGLFQAALLCTQKGLPFELKSQFLQSLAQDVYGQAKQIAITTIDQDQTPGTQIPREQQVQWVVQTAESALLYYIDQHEKQFGPIQAVTPPPDPMMGPEFQPSAGAIPAYPAETEALLPPVGDPLGLSAPEAMAPAAPKGPHPHDKYAAVALLLSTLDNQTASLLMRRFNPDEKQLIQYYQDPVAVDANLDISCVTRHLKTFKQLMKEGSPQLKSKTVDHFEALAKAVPRDRVYQMVSYDRPKVKQYLEGYFPKPDADMDLAFTFWGDAGAQRKKQGLHFREILPPKVEEALYDYLAQKLGQPKPGGAT